MALGLFQRERRSLFGEILDWMLTPLLLLWPISLALTWLVAQNIAGKPFDRALEYDVQALAKLVVVKNNQAQFNLTAPAREILRADDTDLVYYQVVGTHGCPGSGHLKPASSWQMSEHPSPGLGLPSSHCSSPATMPSPHSAAMHSTPTTGHL